MYRLYLTAREIDRSKPNLDMSNLSEQESNKTKFLYFLQFLKLGAVKVFYPDQLEIIEQIKDQYFRGEDIRSEVDSFTRTSLSRQACLDRAEEREELLNSK